MGKRRYTSAPKMKRKFSKEMANTSYPDSSKKAKNMIRRKGRRQYNRQDRHLYSDEGGMGFQHEDVEGALTTEFDRPVTDVVRTNMGYVANVGGNLTDVTKYVNEDGTANAESFNIWKPVEETVESTTEEVVDDAANVEDQPQQDVVDETITEEPTAVNTSTGTAKYKGQDIPIYEGSFNSAYRAARNEGGPGSLFSWNGKPYTATSATEKGEWWDGTPIVEGSDGRTLSREDTLANQKEIAEITGGKIPEGVQIVLNEGGDGYSVVDSNGVDITSTVNMEQLDSLSTSGTPVYQMQGDSLVLLNDTTTGDPSTTDALGEFPEERDAGGGGEENRGLANTALDKGRGAFLASSILKNNKIVAEGAKKLTPAFYKKWQGSGKWLVRKSANLPKSLTKMTAKTGSALGVGVAGLAAYENISEGEYADAGLNIVEGYVYLRGSKVANDLQSVFKKFIKKGPKALTSAEQKLISASKPMKQLGLPKNWNPRTMKPYSPKSKIGKQTSKLYTESAFDKASKKALADAEKKYLERGSKEKTVQQIRKKAIEKSTKQVTKTVAPKVVTAGGKMAALKAWATKNPKQLINKIGKKMGWKFAAKLGAKIGIGTGVNVAPIAGQAVSAAMFAWTAYDIYRIYDALADDPAMLEYMQEMAEGGEVEGNLYGKMNSVGMNNNNYGKGPSATNTSGSTGYAAGGRITDEGSGYATGGKSLYKMLK
jgi:hypothetical protein|tara:strand:+ start:1663 stop:3798 length:2136 start_codon:yes stop_codon:yes gene_type:complete